MKVAELLEMKFYEFSKKIETIVPESKKLVEDVASDEDIDHLEVLDTVLFLFPDERYEYHVDQLLSLKNIELADDQKEKLIPIISEYVLFLNKVKKHLE